MPPHVMPRCTRWARSCATARIGRRPSSYRRSPPASLRLQAFGVTEPDAGSDTTKIKTFARRTEDGYVVDGQKIWTSRAEHSDLMLLLARTTPASEVEKKSDGISVFLVDMRDRGPQLTIKPIKTMMNHATTEIFIDGLELPADALIGEEGMGFRYILDGMNAERILIAAECIGDGRFFIDRASSYAGERVVFGRPIGANQGVQFPLARAHMSVEAAEPDALEGRLALRHRWTAGAEANMAKFLASEASWEAANAALDALGGFGFAQEYDIERKFRETRLYQTAPVANNLVQAYRRSARAGAAEVLLTSAGSQPRFLRNVRRPTASSGPAPSRSAAVRSAPLP